MWEEVFRKFGKENSAMNATDWRQIHSPFQEYERQKKNYEISALA